MSGILKIHNFLVILFVISIMSCQNTKNDFLSEVEKVNKLQDRNYQLFIRAFKYEKELELWIKYEGEKSF